MCYRPIVLTNTIRKTFEKCLKHQVTDFLTKHNVTNTHQFGFQKNLTTTDILLMLLQIVSKKSTGVKNGQAFIFK